jgi:hypothetical protein
MAQALEIAPTDAPALFDAEAIAGELAQLAVFTSLRQGQGSTSLSSY